MIQLGQERILVIAAHPDDEVLGCGATLSRAAREGAEVCVAILGEGPTSRRAEGHLQSQWTVEAVAEILGVKRLLREHLTDQRFDEAGQLTVNHIVADWVKMLAPTIVLCHDATDLNTDHLNARGAALVACRPQSGVKALLSFEVACSSEWAFAHRFRPNVFVRIELVDLARKRDALAAYGELCDSPSPQSWDKMRAAASHTGAIAGCDYAEGLRLLRVTA